MGFFINYYNVVSNLIKDKHYTTDRAKSQREAKKTLKRTSIINYLISFLNREITYLEIGVRNPKNNFDLIQAQTKYSVDPGVEFKENPVDFQMTSDEFFSQLRSGSILSKDLIFDVIFVDGLHLADQVYRDIQNAFDFLKPDGFVILHDCNPPTVWHAREEYRYKLTPAEGYWNGTTWKAFLKTRFNPEIQSCCIDTDWGVGILSKHHPIGDSIPEENIFFEYKDMCNNRKRYLNLMDFETLKKKLES